MCPIGCILNEVDLNKAALWLMIPERIFSKWAFIISSESALIRIRSLLQIWGRVRTTNVVFLKLPSTKCIFLQNLNGPTAVFEPQFSSYSLQIFY